MEWTVVTVLIAVAGLFGAVGAPVIRLNSTCLLYTSRCV